ncbi:DUF3713 domain-containing protein [Mycoplasma parvum]|uniref:Uncharacterized protein n=1 Tax=Mycoplasma parvum str. Indiana TaxID=1403316 RepID=U5ND16_9MOLU|nr:DUF3713 domain-containing protein [Mycoplasma parvum]AGX89230.1 hypothetical protein PRV_02470 [Mycoplasma parvum str. Indiana]
MLAFFTVKKILFTSIVGAGVITPVVATSPIVREFQSWNADISPLKKDIKDFNNIDIYEGESVSSFLKKSLINVEAQEGLIESFAQELSKRWYLSQSTDWTYKQLQEWEEDYEDEYQHAWEKIKPAHPQRDFWDQFWGSKKSMNSFKLRSKSYQLVKSFLTNMSKLDFRINNQQQWNQNSSNNEDISKYFLKRSDVISNSQIENKEDWEKVGFYPTKQYSRGSEIEKMIWGKYDFLNWAYRKWFEENLPIYFWLISWNYDQNATEYELKNKYNFSFLKEKKPARASYSFPIFSEKSIKNFKSFLEKIGQHGNNGSNSNQNQLNLEKKYIPVWMSDQPYNGTIIELLNSFENNTVEEASVVSYLINKKLNNKNSTGTSSQPNNVASKEINKLSLKNGSSSKTYEDPISIFLDKKDSRQVKAIEFDSRILKNNKDSSNHIYDVRETDIGWTFFRDEKGIHAIRLDGEDVWGKNNSNGVGNIKDLFNWFNFRNLQSNWNNKTYDSHEKSIKVSKNWEEQFSSFLDSNFNRLLMEFFVFEHDKSSLFAKLKDKEYFQSYVEIFKKLIELKREYKNYSKIIELRKKIIKNYGEKDWELRNYSFLNKYPLSHPQEGLSSSFAYKVSSKAEDKEERFPDQEGIFKLSIGDLNESSKNMIQTASSSASTLKSKKPEFLNKLAEYYSSVDQLLKNKKIDLKVRGSDYNVQDSQRIFIKDPIFDYLLDKLLTNKDFVNYIVKEKKLLESNFFSSNKLFNKKDQQTSNDDWDYILKIQNESHQLLTADAPSENNGSSINGNSSQNQQSSSENSTLQQECVLQDWNFREGKELKKPFNSLLWKYLFKNYLRRMGDNYFNFWVEFPEFKSSNNLQQVRVSTETSVLQKTNSLSEFELFYIWQKNNLRSVKEKTSLLDFFIALHYLTKNKFENLRKSLSNELGNKDKYHYLLFELRDKKEDKAIVHPFLRDDDKTSEQSIKFFDSKKDLKLGIRKFWKEGIEVEEEKNESNGAPNSSNATNGNGTTEKKKIPLFLLKLEKNKDSIPDESSNLFNFSSLDKLIKYINSINSFGQLDDIVFRLSKINNNIWPSFYKTELIHYYEDNSNNKLLEKRLYLEDKKKALIYQLLHTDKSLYASKYYKKEEIEEIFNKKVEEITQSSQTNGNKKLDNKYFERKRGNGKKEKKDNYFIQVSGEDFSSEEKLCQLFKKLPTEILSELIIQETEELNTKEKSMNEFFSGTYKLKAHDIKFQSNVDQRHLS